MNENTEERVLADVAAIVRDVIGEEWSADVPIEMETSFSQDLELESIEFVALAEQIKARYGKGVDFTAWLASMDIKEILALRVGQLVELIVRCSTQRATA